jgi:hypothetical protein
MIQPQRARRLHSDSLWPLRLISQSYLIRFSIALALFISLAIVARASTDSALSQGDEPKLIVSAEFADRNAVAPDEQIAFAFNRSLQKTDGRIAVLIGKTDVSAFLAMKANAISYLPRIPLPHGESQVTVWQVAADGQWRELAHFTLRVAPRTTATELSAPSAERERPRWKLNVAPNVSVNIRSQIAEGHFPDDQRPERRIFTDAALQSSTSVNLLRGGFIFSHRFDIAGSSFQKEALRFGELGNAAPQLDLAAYLIQAQCGGANLSLGHVTFGANRRLINSFASRGLTVTLPLGKRADFSAAVMNGTSIVGWSNFFGLDNREHQIVSGTLGFELSRERKGGSHLEFGVVSGSLLSRNHISQRAITHAERRAGASVRFVASEKNQCWRIDGGFARSRFTNPADPQLDQSANVVPVRETTRNAGYLDTSYVLLRDLKLSEQKRASLTFNYRHEQVDPFFRSMAAFTQADRFQNQYELVGVIGGITATVSHLRFNDNLDDIPSVLKTLTRRSGLIVGGPLADVFGNPAKVSRWLPRFAYSFDHTHQFGAGIPVNGGFRPDLVPDQISASHNFSAEWAWTKWRAAYRFNRSFQDNRQPGRELTDFLNLVNGVTLGFTPNPAFDLSFDVNAEQARNFETARLDRTLRFAIISNWRVNSRANLTLNLSTPGAGDLTRTARNRTIEGDAQWSYRLGFGEGRLRKLQGQFFVRCASRYARFRDNLFQVNTLSCVWTVNTGMNFTF